ncbi:DarT ssDNA thymidine ADP-ribosyltransferase family protein [Arthrobacter sp. NPDC058130]|uniref:DarT ssDNA thymidine ADP-ribosyltransferase family protein n=1 Tax=Arthrobacter sp. NPDC058130 TaxID=3346353 RepID=UPI0036E8496E
MTAEPDLLVVGFAQERNITEVLHFTTNRGLIGIFDRGAVCSRDQLNEDERLDSVKLLNCESRHKDAAWTGYVNMSISRVNNSMLGTSQRWHERAGIWWAVLSFDPEILGHQDVQFTTTNNTYPVVRRQTGLKGITDLFSETVPYGYYGSVVRRHRGSLPEHTTDVQAEVLYPASVALSWLRSIYVPEPEHIDEIAGWVAAFSNVPNVDVACKPEIFQ